MNGKKLIGFLTDFAINNKGFTEQVKYYNMDFLIYLLTHPFYDVCLFILWCGVQEEAL